MKELRFALKKTVPVLFAYLFIGISFGMMMYTAGYSWIWSFLSALFVYAGSLQIVMVSLLKAGAGLMTCALTAFFINARHLFYGIAFIERFRAMGWRSPYMVFSLTDETYSILVSADYGEGLNRDRAAFFIALTNHIYWIIGCLTGSLAGRILPWDMEGIEFSAAAFFIVVVIEQWEKSASKLPACIGLIVGTLFFLILGPDRFLIPSLASSILILMLLGDRIRIKEGMTDEN